MYSNCKLDGISLFMLRQLISKRERETEREIVIPIIYTVLCECVVPLCPDIPAQEFHYSHCLTLD